MTAWTAHARTWLHNWLQAILLAAGVIVLIGISAASVYLVSQARNDAKQVAHTLEVENQISLALLQIRRAEGAERGFLITSLQSYLDDFDQAKSLIMPTFDALYRLTADNDKQRQLLSAALPLIKSRIAEFDTVNELTKASQFDRAREIVRQSSANRTTEQIRDLLAAMQQEEDRLFVFRTHAADSSQQLAAIVTSAGAATVLLLTGFLMLLVRRSNRARDEAQRQLREANVDLEAAVEERTADLKEANEEIQRFAYIVSHDLRSPLVNITGFTSELEAFRDDVFARIAALKRQVAAIPATAEGGDTLSRDERDADDEMLANDFSEALGFIKSSTDKMDRLISAILKLNREGRREFKPETIDVRALISGIAATVAHQAAEANAEIEVEPLPDIVSDRLALEQIFSNLIDNALKYLSPGVPGRVVIKGRRKLRYAVYDVIDNGRGIDPKDHVRIFDLFRRAGPQDRPGQGIGLAHVRTLVRRLGGMLSVKSEPGSGSTFTVTLPTNWTFGVQGKRDE